jgi:hypothetical protein
MGRAVMRIIADTETSFDELLLIAIQIVETVTSQSKIITTAVGRRAGIYRHKKIIATSSAAIIAMNKKFTE